MVWNSTWFLQVWGGSVIDVVAVAAYIATELATSVKNVLCTIFAKFYSVDDDEFHPCVDVAGHSAVLAAVPCWLDPGVEDSR